MLRYCPSCKTEKDLVLFATYKETRYTIGKDTRTDSWCKACKAKWRKESYVAKPLSSEAIRRQKIAWVKRKYSLSIEEYEEILKNPCNICGDTRKKHVLDHCHISGKNRGSLCYWCNARVGWYEKRKDIIHDYLEKGVTCV